ncbi:MAG: RNA polymerase sigma factor [Verrucomicrobiaceae bacterium]|nr:RNA polymerase sigma factor [Verrucomicrobiaceae bacterium]
MPSSRDDLDSELMRALADGDDLALNSLMEAWTGPLIAFFTRLTGDRAIASDLAQETFMRIYRHRFRFRQNERFSTWLFAIGANIARNHARWRNRHPETLLAHEEIRELPPATGEASPDEHVVLRERQAAVQRAVSTLPHDLREVVVLATWHGLSHAEIGKALQISTKAVETRLYRARKILRDLLAKTLEAP